MRATADPEGIFVNFICSYFEKKRVSGVIPRRVLLFDPDMKQTSSIIVQCLRKKNILKRNVLQSVSVLLCELGKGKLCRRKMSRLSQTDGSVGAKGYKTPGVLPYMCYMGYVFPLWWFGIG